MIAARLHAYDAPMTLDRIEVPEPRPNDVLVEVKAYGVVPNLARVDLSRLEHRVSPLSKVNEVATADGSKVVYHLTDLDKVDFVLGNIRNHFDGMGRPNKVTIALVVHGPALKAFRSSDAGGDVSKRTDELSKSGLQMHACGIPCGP